MPLALLLTVESKELGAGYKLVHERVRWLGVGAEQGRGHLCSCWPNAQAVSDQVQFALA